MVDIDLDIWLVRRLSGYLVWEMEVDIATFVFILRPRNTEAWGVYIFPACIPRIGFILNG